MECLLSFRRRQFAQFNCSSVQFPFNGNRLASGLCLSEPNHHEGDRSMLDNYCYAAHNYLIRRTKYELGYPNTSLGRDRLSKIFFSISFSNKFSRSLEKSIIQEVNLLVRSIIQGSKNSSYSFIPLYKIWFQEVGLFDRSIVRNFVKKVDY